MFLRTAQTEQRIEELEKAVADIERRLNLLDGKNPETDAAAPKGYDGEPGAGEDAPIPEPEKPLSKIAQKVMRRATIGALTSGDDAGVFKDPAKGRR